MSQRYLAGFIQAGLFNPLAAPPPPTYTYELWSWGYNAQGQLGLKVWPHPFGPSVGPRLYLARLATKLGCGQWIIFFACGGRF